MKTLPANDDYISRTEKAEVPNFHINPNSGSQKNLSNFGKEYNKLSEDQRYKIGSALTPLISA